MGEESDEEEDLSDDEEREVQFDAENSSDEDERDVQFDARNANENN